MTKLEKLFLTGNPLDIPPEIINKADDPQKILSLASQHDGNLTIETIVVALGWTDERVRNALDLLVSTGVAKVQKSYSKSTQYWFPGFRSRKK